MISISISVEKIIMSLIYIFLSIYDSGLLTNGDFNTWAPAATFRNPEELEGLQR